MLGRGLDYYIGILREGGPYIPHLLNQTMFLIKKGKLKEAKNYMLAHLLDKEDGAGLGEPLYRRNSDWAPYPQRIEVEVTTLCSLRCQKCEHTYWDQKEQTMTFDQFKHITDQFPTLRSISLSGIGHGMERKDVYFKIIEYLRKKNIFIQFFDTFLFMDEASARKMIDTRVNKIWLSIDGATKETYNHLHVGSDFDVVIKNTRRLIQMKKERKELFPEVMFHYIVQKPNVNEMPDFIDLIHDIMKDDPSKLITVQFTRLIPFKENEHLIPHIPQEIVDKTVKRAKKYGNFRLEFCNVPDFSKKIPVSECTAWTVPYITVEGDYYPCDSLTEKNIRKDVEGKSFGNFHFNLFKEDFRDIWYSDNLTKFKKAFNQGMCPKICYHPSPCSLFDIDKDKVRDIV